MKTVVAASIILIALVSVADATEWQGQVVTEDGVRIIENPETALEELSVEMSELWRRGDEEDDLFFGLPSEVLQDDGGNVYVLDSQISEIIVLSPSGEYLRTIGREGEGPGEFTNSSDMYIGPGNVIGVVRIFPGKIVQLMPDGAPAGNFPLPVDGGEGFQLIFRASATEDRIVICGGKQSRGETSRGQENYLKAFDAEGNELAHFHSMEEHTQFGGMKFDEKVFANFKGQWSLASDGRVAAVLDFDAYRIHVWNPDGTLSHVIERPDYPPLERTNDERERFQRFYDGITRWNPNSTFEVSQTHRGIFQVYFSDDGSLWALSGRGVWARDNGVFAEFDVYDRDGRFIRRVALLGDGDPFQDGIYFASDRLYRVSDTFSAMMANFAAGEGDETEEEGEPLQLIAYKLDSGKLGMSR